MNKYLVKYIIKGTNREFEELFSSDTLVNAKKNARKELGKEFEVVSVKRFWL
ncbi:MAG: hypothetical protein ACRCVJ_18575 [Clostridium sp.]|uniref:hypothetical protein n=1 Tax=Clostridium sp. TaxID=1506 RepID=UPI003F2D9EB7